MNIVITMAGLGQRFRDAGYDMPKYCITAKGRTLFDWSMESLKSFRREEDTYIFILRAEDEKKQFILDSCRDLGISHASVIELSHPTDGQATTALLAASEWNREDGLYIYNIDTYVEAGWMNPEEIQGDGFIPCFEAPGDHWSFVRLNESGDAVEVREKQRISDYCTLGAYYFRSAKLYEELYREYYEEGLGAKADASTAERRERYVAPLYSYLIEKGGAVRISNVPADKVHVLGTPDELQVFLNE